MIARERLNFAIAESSLDKILIATNDQGVRAILIERTLENCMGALFTACNSPDITHDKDLENLAIKIARYIENPESKLDIKLDMHSIDFQIKVWNALREIPIGTTTTYREIAEKIGQPEAVRAIVEACAANIIAAIIPCHRVIKSDDDISGYSWDAELKQKLLEIESASRSVRGK